MNQTPTLPIDEIIVTDRTRVDFGDLSALADSIRRYGLIEPVCVNQNKTLVAGERRLRASRLAGLTHVPVHYKETTSEDLLSELEMEENIRRHQMSWQEECLGVAKIHWQRIKRGAVENWEWGQKQTGEMFGVSIGKINYALHAAKLLEAEKLLPLEKRRFWKCDSATDVWKLVMRDEEDLMLAELAERQRRNANSNLTDLLNKPLSPILVPLPRDEILSAKEKYYSNPLNPPDSFDAYWAEKTARETEAPVVYLSNRLFQGDSIAFMNDPANAGRFNHILTDIPYGIDVEQMAQDFGGMKDIDTIMEEHDPEDNLMLISRFFSAAFRCTQDNAFVITWADQMLWNTMYEFAIDAGFQVQRWPLTWVKTNSCKNSAAQYNTTKTTEIAIVCRKPKAVIAKQPGCSHIVANNEAMKQLCGHPFSKPRECWEFLADLVSIEGQTILDPFAGRGSCALSLLPKNRHVYSCELNVAHFNSLIENLKQYYLKLNPKFTFK